MNPLLVDARRPVETTTTTERTAEIVGVSTSRLIAWVEQGVISLPHPHEDGTLIWDVPAVTAAVAVQAVRIASGRTTAILAGDIIQAAKAAALVATQDTLRILDGGTVMVATGSNAHRRKAPAGAPPLQDVYMIEPQAFELVRKAFPRYRMQ